MDGSKNVVIFVRRQTRKRTRHKYGRRLHGAGDATTTCMMSPPPRAKKVLSSKNIILGMEVVVC